MIVGYNYSIPAYGIITAARAIAQAHCAAIFASVFETSLKVWCSVVTADTGCGQLRTMEAEQQRLRMMKESVEWKLAEARANRLGLQVREGREEREGRKKER